MILQVFYEIVKSTLKLWLRPRASYSQFGEDQIVAQILPQKTGAYLDVGCYHPHLYSNTFLLYKRGWRGICIDPNPLVGRLFYWFRPKDTFINAGVGAQGELKYHMYTDGAYNGFSPAERVHKGVRLLGTKSIDTRPLSSLVPDGVPIDYLNVDVEGMDLEVLQTLDWSKHHPAVITVEGEESSGFLGQKGYVRVQTNGKTVIWKAATDRPFI